MGLEAAVRELPGLKLPTSLQQVLDSEAATCASQHASKASCGTFAAGVFIGTDFGNCPCGCISTPYSILTERQIVAVESGEFRSERG